MLILCVYVHVSRKREAFREATMENARNSRREPGVARFDLMEQADDPARFMLYEVYRDAARRRRQGDGALPRLGREDGDMFVEARTRQLYRAIDPATANGRGSDWVMTMPFDSQRRGELCLAKAPRTKRLGGSRHGAGVRCW